MIIKDAKQPVYQHRFTPEAGILVQNTMNISEVYIDARETYKKDPPSHAAFSKVINNKFRAFDQDREYPTVEFATKAYYNEAVKLSERPWAYQTEKINPIQKFIPVNFDTRNL